MKKFLLILSTVIILGIGLSGYIYSNSIKPFKKAETAAIKKAKQVVNLQLVDEVYIYNGNQSSATVTGITENNEAVVIFLLEDRNEYMLKNANEGITKQQAINIVTQEKQPKEIVSVKLGIEKTTPFWEVYYTTEESPLNYYYLDFQTGEWLKKIENL